MTPMDGSCDSFMPDTPIFYPRVELWGWGSDKCLAIYRRLLHYYPQRTGESISID